MTQKIFKISPEVKRVYEKFSQKPYAENIATPISMEALFCILKSNRPKKILEIGGGIGTLSYLILKNSDSQLDIIENLDFCIKELEKNLEGINKKYNLIKSYDIDLLNDNYDLVVVDGGKKDFTYLITNKLSNKGVIYIDGNRQEQRSVLRKGLKNKYIFNIRKYIDKSRKLKGGFEIRYLVSSSIIIRNLNYYYWEIFYIASSKIANGLRRLFGQKFLRDYEK